jgi:hypothetical protein
MKTYVVGSADDQAGFALAGATPLSPDELRRVDAADSIVVFSADAARLDDELLSKWRRTGTGPLFVVLPEG